jgi:hypothetical protein
LSSNPSGVKKKEEEERKKLKWKEN